MEFTVRAKISESATTSVYRAYHETLGRDVLLKVLHRHIAGDEQARQRFVREAHACAALRSEHIVQVYDLRDYEGSPAIVMEFVEGRSLKEIIADGDLRTFAFTEKVAVHVLRGLSVAHARGVFHRDIKPGNILVSPDGVVKITDFGLAQISVAPTITAEGAVVGTPAYLAPEIVRGEPADARTDLFSLGATLVETLTGERLFEGDTYADCLNRIAQFRTEQLENLAAVSSPEFADVLKRMMHPDKKGRFSSAEEALAALKTTGSSRRVPITRTTQRSHVLFWGIGGAALLALSAGIYLLSRPAEMPAVRPHGDTTTAVTPVTSERPRIDTTARPVPTTAGRIAPVKPQPADSGLLAFAGDAGTRVSVDGQPVGELPLTILMTVEKGRHAVVFSHPPFEPIVQTVDVEGGQQVRVSAEFLATAGYLRCTALPWAEISVDDVYRETTPTDRPIVVSPGTRHVRFHHPRFRDSVRTVVVAPKETVSVSMDFTR